MLNCKNSRPGPPPSLACTRALRLIGFWRAVFAHFQTRPFAPVHPRARSSSKSGRDKTSPPATDTCSRSPPSTGYYSPRRPRKARSLLLSTARNWKNNFSTCHSFDARPSESPSRYQTELRVRPAPLPTSFPIEWSNNPGSAGCSCPGSCSCASCFGCICWPQGTVTGVNFGFRFRITPRTFSILWYYWSVEPPEMRMRPEARRARLFAGQKVLALTLERSHAENWKTESPPTVRWCRLFGSGWFPVVGASEDWHELYSFPKCGGSIHSTITNQNNRDFVYIDLIKPGKSQQNKLQNQWR